MGTSFLGHLQPAAFMGAALVPAVLISACALLLLSFSNRLVAVVGRQRSLHRELLEAVRRRPRNGGGGGGGLASAWPSFAGGSGQDTPVMMMVGGPEKSCSGCCHQQQQQQQQQHRQGGGVANCNCHGGASASGPTPQWLSGACAALAEEQAAEAEWAAATQAQVRALRREAVCIRAAISALLTAILLFLGAGITLAASALAPAAEGPALLVFLAGLAAFAGAVATMLFESMLIITPVALEQRSLNRIVTRSGASASGAASQQASHVCLQVLAAAP
jgi:hypothetical protein